MADIIARCEAKGLRMTEQRRIVARVIGEATDHPDVEELYARALALDPRISLATVYRSVKIFEEAGILERLERQLLPQRQRFLTDKSEFHIPLSAEGHLRMPFHSGYMGKL